MANELPPVVISAQKFRQRLINQDAAVARRLISSYGRAYQRLMPMTKALETALIEAGAEASELLRTRSALFESLLDAIRSELERYAVIAGDTIDEAVALNIAQAIGDSDTLIQLAMPQALAAEIGGSLQRINPEAVETIAGFFAEDSQLRTNLNKIGEGVADIVEEKLAEAVVLGFNPRTVARLIRKATGEGLNWSLRTARTAQLYAYRETTRQTYQENEHVVRGWIWFASLDSRVCMSCVQQHGSFHTNDEILNDHFSGRCSMIPETRSMRELGIDIPEEPVQIQRGEDWFKAQPEAVQRQLMGASKFRAWQDDAFSFDALSVERDDLVYVAMRSEASLKSILVDEAGKYYSP